MSDFATQMSHSYNSLMSNFIIPMIRSNNLGVRFWGSQLRGQIFAAQMLGGVELWG